MIKVIINDKWLNFDYQELLYQEFSIYIIWNYNYHRWNWWKMNIDIIIKWIYFIDSSDNKRFYLYIFLQL